MQFELLFLGGLFPKEREKEIIDNSKGCIQNAANILQWHLVNGIDHIMQNPISILNALYIGSYPKRYKQMFIPEYEFQHTIGAKDKNVGFCNLTIFKHFSREKSIKKEIKKWLRKSTDKPRAIIAYALTKNFISALDYARRCDPQVYTFMIVPDLPQYMSSTTSLIYKFAKQMEIQYIQRYIKKINGFILLTKQMNEYIQSNNYIIVEAVATELFSDIPRIADDKIKRIVYTGTLAERYGIKDLIKAFSLIHSDDYELIICGYGDSEQYIRDASLKDSRIHFWGSVSRERALYIQKNATVLVNPRSNEGEYTKYSFPSKNMEYLSSGVPLVAYKLDGIPDDYDPYIIYIKERNITCIKDTLIRVCEMPKEKRKKLGESAKQFVLSEKNKNKQAAKIVELIEKTIQKDLDQKVVYGKSRF